MPCMAEAVTSGCLIHTSSCFFVRPGRVKHTVLALRMGSKGIFSPRISFESALEERMKTYQVSKDA